MKHRRFVFIFSLLICVIAVGFIFINSLQNAQASNSFSIRVADFLRQFLNTYGSDNFHEYIRKLAHCFEFCVLGGAIGILMHLIQEIRGRYYVAASLLLLLSVAVIDEYIQTFTIGRAGLVNDILIDFGGGLIGLAITVLPLLFRNRCRNRERA